MELQWPLILFTTFIAWSCGVFAFQAYLAFRGEGREIQVPALIVSVALLAISGISVFFHLEHWERIFNGFGHITSGITQELIAIVLFVIVAAVYFAYVRKAENGGTIPKWLAIAAIAISVILALVCAHSYMMAARPAWDTFAWMLAELIEGLSLGALTVMAMLAAKGGDSKTGGMVSIACTALNAVVSAVLIAIWQASSSSFTDVGFHFDPTSPTSPLVDIASEINILSGELAPLVWMGIVVVGAIAPLAFALVGTKKGTKSWVAAGALGTICLLVGCIALRITFYSIGFSVFMFY